MEEQAMNVKDLFSIAGKVALVTGGSRGIGLMIARAYVEAGARVYISSRKKEVCDQVASELSETGPCFSIPADLSSVEGCKHLAAELSSREEALHILVNNAGAAWGASIEEYPEAGFDKVMDTNVKGVFFLTQALLPLLEKAGSLADPARVINVGSIDGLTVPFQIDNYAYGPSKAAVHHLTRMLAVKLGERGITVNAIAPGPFESQMTKWLLETYKDSVEANCPLKRIGSPEDMAGAAIYLASRAGAYVNGVVIPVDGGISIK
ncbi:MAG TPA: SDR family oxidoreductase [Blastocatellia bacterium]|jgi:NAD(P)-dependent dehydrogenase (short-subunit alcohol dehydrogenase family)|nr:SDR family oxidoreductase [Blastocatellia bacterium]